MEITLQIPDVAPDLAALLQEHWGDLARPALEALAVEAYRGNVLTLGQIRRLLGYETPMQVDDLLARYNVYYHYDEEDILQDLEASRMITEARTRA